MTVHAHQPCKDCGSSDALTIYDDHSFCFSCEKWTPKEVNKEDFTYQYIPWRGVSKDTMRAFNVRTKIDGSGTPISIGFPYPSGVTKVRLLASKQFYALGETTDKTKPLFGQDIFPASSARSITITEGELDALSVYEMMGNYPVVSISSAAVAKSAIAAAHEYINSFDKIYLCLDSDEPGRRATKEIAQQFDFNKVYDVKLAKKDANEYLEANESALFKKIWWSAKRFLPEGIVSSFSEIDEIIDSDEQKQSISYPFPTLQDMTYGIRNGEVVLLTALEGIGKTEIFRAIEFDILKKTDENIGIIHLEEGKSRLIKGLAGYELEKPVHLPDQVVSKEEIKSAFRRVVGRDDRVHIYTHFGSDDLDVILSTIRFLVASCGCKYVFLDHISMLVTGRDSNDEREALDYLSTRFEWLVKELDFTLFLISHVNDEGLTRGSRNISKTCDLWVHMHRNKTADMEEERNTTYLTVNKNRFGGRTGPAGRLFFDKNTYKINELIEVFE
jgi:twinkle protein